MGAVQTECILKQISEENIHRLLEVLKKNLPDSIVPYHWISTQLHWAKNISELKLQILCPDGDWKDGTVVCLADGLAGGNKIYGIVYALDDKTSDLKEALMKTNLIDWARVKYFSATCERHLDLMVEVLKEKGYTHARDFHTPLLFYYMSVEEAQNFPLPELSENIRIGPLNASHLDVICKYWLNYDPEYEPVVLKMIELNTSVGLFVTNDQGKEEVASVVLQPDYGGVGLMATVPAFRRKGYAAVALANMIRVLGQKGIMPFAVVLLKNEASSMLFRKFGFKTMDLKYWVLVNP